MGKAFRLFPEIEVADFYFPIERESKKRINKKSYFEGWILIPVLFINSKNN